MFILGGWGLREAMINDEGRSSGNGSYSRVVKGSCREEAWISGGGKGKLLVTRRGFCRL